MTGYQAQSFAGFGKGLNLRDKADAISEEECIDAMNVVFTERGSVEQRSGYDNLTSSALTNAVASLAPYYKTDGTRQLIAGCGTRLEALSSAGAVVASQTGLTTGIWDFCRFGAPGSEVIYAANGANRPYKWDGSAWTAVLNANSRPKYFEVIAVDQGNRMVAAGFPDSATGSPGGAQSYTSRVWFSDAGAPETFGANNYVDVTPGDGETIQAVVAWRERVFVFKETKFFVFYGTSTDSSGNPVFNYQTIDTGVGLASSRAVAVAPDGVYFMARDGVYFTSGGDPDQISDLVDPIWTGVVSDYYTGGVLAHGSITNCAMTYFNGQVYLAFPTSSANNRVLVHDPRYGWWSLWDIPAACLTSFRPSSQPELVFGYASGSNHVGRYSSSYTNDDGTAITSYWRSGWVDYGLSIDKTIRESKAWGYGKVFVGISKDFQLGTGERTQITMEDPTLSTWGGTTWGGSTWASPSGRLAALRRYAVRGTAFSTSFYNNTLDQTWTIARLDHHLRESRIPSVKTA